MRCMHENQMHKKSCFITLTYDDQHVPTDYSVKLRDWQLFLKKLRKSLRSQKIRFFACGEYGDTNLRPHYHALIFGYDFPDKTLYSIRKNKRYYKSSTLDALWGKSQINEIADVNYQTAGYVARYCLKKYKGENADDHYSRLSPIDGQVHRVQPEFCVMSRRPGIGTTWFHKFKSDAFPSDFLIVDGKKHKPPKFYLQLLKEDEQTKIKRARKRFSLTRRSDQTKERLATREFIQNERAKRLKRTI